MYFVLSHHRFLLGHGECQAVHGHLNLVLGLQVSHPIGADAIDGDDDVALDQVPLRCFATGSDLLKKHLQ